MQNKQLNELEQQRADYVKQADALLQRDFGDLLQVERVIRLFLTREQLAVQLQRLDAAIADAKTNTTKEEK